MRRIPLRNKHGKIHKWAIVDDRDYKRVKKFSWSATKAYNTWYASAGHGPRKNVIRFRLHRFIASAPKGKMVDHINGNGLDNRRFNLRICTNSQNGMNRGKTKGNTSGYKGVTYHKRTGKFVAQTSSLKNGKRTHTVIGYFKNKIDAARAYDKVVKKRFGKFAYQNFPKP